ncbi:Nitrate reductase [Alicycliphilus sp. B1]|nr:Nitrate reductase [Alicycliphilus sp. B1]
MAEYRLRYPMKLVGGKYERISWDQALDEIAARMQELRKASGPDSVYFVGSSKHSNEQSYLMRKFVSFWGSEQLRPPGAHLPQHHGRRRGQHLGLWRDDQFVQRHAEQQVRVLHRLQRRRGAPGEHAAHAARQGKPAAR